MFDSTTKTSAQAVSRKLRTLGFVALGANASRMREGVRVRQSGNRVYVTADLNDLAAGQKLAEEMAAKLSGAGFSVEAAAVDSFYVGANHA
jgi:phage replication-related protein YjqB (UPF0714/DUF867 family)